MDKLAGDHGIGLTLGDTRYARVLRGVDRRDAVHIAKTMVSEIPKLVLRKLPEGAPECGLSAGIATLSLPPRNFPPSQLIEAAERCLYAAENAGGAAVNSIDL